MAVPVMCCHELLYFRCPLVDVQQAVNVRMVYDLEGVSVEWHALHSVEHSKTSAIARVTRMAEEGGACNDCP